MNISELKSKARLQIKGKIGILLGITLLISLLSGAASGILSLLIPTAGTLIASIVTSAFALSISRVYLLVISGTEPEIDDAFYGFSDFWCAFKLSFFIGLYTFLWSLLFIVPGIIKGISYSMSMYILAENKGKSAHECINESMIMTDGHKKELFLLGLSFIGWILLGWLTFGIAYIWIIPYMSATYANAYEFLKPVKAELNQENEADGSAAEDEHVPVADSQEMAKNEPEVSESAATEDMPEVVMPTVVSPDIPEVVMPTVVSMDMPEIVMPTVVSDDMPKESENSSESI